MISLVKKIFVRINNCNNYSTDYNINRYSKLLDKYYKEKITRCKICHINNKCSVVDIYKLNNKYDNYILKKSKEFNCLK